MIPYSKFLFKETLVMEVSPRFSGPDRRKFRGDYRTMTHVVGAIDACYVNCVCARCTDPGDAPGSRSVFGARTHQYVKPRVVSGGVHIKRQYRTDVIISVPSTQERREARKNKRLGLVVPVVDTVKFLSCFICPTLCKGHVAS